MKIPPIKNINEKRLVEDIRAEVKKLREENVHEYHAILLERAADAIEKLVYLKT